MDGRDDATLHRRAAGAAEDTDLRDVSVRSSHRGWWFAAVLTLDAVAIAAFITWVVIPKLT
jgi:hypothetical protein